jgi:hypothetical protein
VCAAVDTLFAPAIVMGSWKILKTTGVTETIAGGMTPCAATATAAVGAITAEGLVALGLRGTADSALRAVMDDTPIDINFFRRRLGRGAPTLSL